MDGEPVTLMEQRLIQWAMRPSGILTFAEPEKRSREDDNNFLDINIVTAAVLFKAFTQQVKAINDIHNESLYYKGQVPTGTGGINSFIPVQVHFLNVEYVFLVKSTAPDVYHLTLSSTSKSFKAHIEKNADDGALLAMFGGDTHCIVQRCIAWAWVPGQSQMHDPVADGLALEIDGIHPFHL